MFSTRLRAFRFDIAVAALLSVMLLPPRPARAQSTITVSVIGDFSSRNPYADSTAQMYGIWCQVYGCLGTYDPKTADYKGMLAESWTEACSAWSTTMTPAVPPVSRRSSARAEVAASRTERPVAV